MIGFLLGTFLFYVTRFEIVLPQYSIFWVGGISHTWVLPGSMKCIPITCFIYWFFLKLLLGITLDAIQKLVIILILLPSQNHGKGCSFFNLPMVMLLYCTVQYNEIVYICKFGQTFLARSPFFKKLIPCVYKVHITNIFHNIFALCTE